MYDNLLQLPLFQGLCKDDFTTLIEKVKLHFITCKEGETIAAQDEICNRLLFILDGEVTVKRTDKEHHYSLTEQLDAPHIIELYSMFGVAYQNDFVPRGTVRENIDFFRGISDEEIGRATEISQARDFIDGLEGGLDHEIATRGMNVSGGQRQRLLVSRAVLGDPDILILDDASSALDYKTDAALRSAIKHKVNTTTIIVSQRVASVRSADKILVLDGGRAAGLGTHDELIKSNPEYRDIAAVQMSLEEVSV